MKTQRKWIPIFLLPTVLLFLFIYAIPLVTVVFSSFFKWKGIEFTFIGFKNYIQLFTNDKEFLAALKNTIIWVLLQSTIHVGLGVLMALILTKKPKGWKFVRTAYMLPNIISASALALIYYNVFNAKNGVINSILEKLGLRSNINWYFDKNTAFGTVTYTWLFFAGLVTILVMAEIMSIDQEVLESARVDGAENWQIDLYIILPLIKNIIGTVIILSATSMLKEFELIHLTTEGGPGTRTLNLPLYLYKTTMLEGNYGYANTIGTLTIVIGVAIILFINKSMKMGNSDI